MNQSPGHSTIACRVVVIVIVGFQTQSQLITSSLMDTDYIIKPMRNNAILFILKHVHDVTYTF